MAATTNVVDSNVKQAGKFGLVGLINTALDFGILNLLIITFGLGVIASNTVSTGIAMSFSFLANKHSVFKARGGSPWRQAVTFFAVTIFGLWVLQNSVIALLTLYWIAPLELGVSIIDALGLGDTLSRQFIFANGAKAAATVASLVWNFIMYKKVVFHK